MDFLMEQEVKGFGQDFKHGIAKQDADKLMFEKKLLEGLGEEMEEEIKNPKSKLPVKKQKIARKLNRKKKWAVWKENLRKILIDNKKGDQ